MLKSPLTSVLNAENFKWVVVAIILPLCNENLNTFPTTTYIEC